MFASAALVIAVIPANAALAPPPLPAPPRFVAGVDNPWFPLRPKRAYLYRGFSDGQPSRERVTVLRQRKRILGVACTVVSDKLYVRGRLRESTRDWYAQDRTGNVWYLGEATAEFARDGSIETREGSWQAGVAGARAGIYMPAHPRAGQSGVQELYPGHAEDRFRVLSRSARVSTPAASSRHALLIREWTPLEPGVVDHKLYVRGIGTVLERNVRGGSERNELVAVRR